MLVTGYVYRERASAAGSRVKGGGVEQAFSEYGVYVDDKGYFDGRTAFTVCEAREKASLTWFGPTWALLKPDSRLSS